jgi:hypothetical protein
MQNEVIYSPVYSEITLGDISIYVYKSKIILSSKYTEKPTVTGDIALTSYSDKAVRVILDAKIHIFDDDFDYVVYFDEAMRNEKRFTFSINGIKITQGKIISSSFESFIESGYILCSFVFVSENKLEKEDKTSQSANADSSP